MEKEHGIWKGAIILSLVALFAKVLSAGYRIPYQNIAGDLGYYVYQQVYPFYGFVMILAMYGFPVVISKYIAEERAKGQEQEAKLLFSLSFYGLLFFGVSSMFILFGGAPLLAVLIGDPKLTAPLRAVSFSFLLLPFLSSSRGFYQGHDQMIPTAVSHLVEQLIRVCAILVLAIIFIEQGSGAYGAGIGAAYGSLLGGVVSLFVLFSFSKHLKNRHQWFQLKGTNRRELVKKSLTIFKQSLFICLSALVFILFQFIDVFSLIRLLGWYGLYGEDAYLAKGIYDRGQPLLQLGTVLTMTFSLTLVPLLAKAVAKNELILARSYHDLALRLTFLIGGAATIGLMVVIEPTNSMLFTDRSGSDVLRILSVAIIASTLSMTLSAILQGYGYVHLPALVLGIGVMSKIIFNVVLVPMYGTKGAAFATVLSFAMMVVIQLQLLKRITGKISVNYHSYRAIAITFILMFITTSIWKRAIETLFTNELTRILETALAISTVGIGGLTVLVGLLRFGILSESEWETIPRLERLRQLVVRKRS